LADTIYWIDFPATIRRAPLAGGGTIDNFYASPPGAWNTASGLAIDPAAGRIYWTSWGDDGTMIRRAPLAGGGPVDVLYDSGDGVSQPFGLAIDKAAGRIYWSNGGDDTIRRAPLAGGGPVVTLYDSAHGVSGPRGLAIDPTAGRIYWSNGVTATICGAPLAPGPVDTLYGPAQGVGGPVGLAIDPAAGRIYWTNWFYVAQGMIRGAPLAVGGSVNDLYGASVPSGVAIDPNPAAPERLEVRDVERFAIGRWLRDLFSRPSGPPGRIYWSSGSAAHGGEAPTPGDNTVRAAPLAGGGSVDTLYGPAQWLSGPGALALLRAPLGTGPPTISWQFVLDDGPFRGLEFGGGHSGPLDRQLTCSRGTWAPDLPGCLLYRAPESFAYQWRLNGTDIGAATAAHYTPDPTAPGSYSCRVTATNQSGSATQTSAAVAIS
jgi:hypothetical protein